MGIADRDYHRAPQRREDGYAAHLTPVVKALLAANAGIFILDYLILPAVFDIRVDELNRPPLVEWGAFSIGSALMQGKIWEFVTFQFLHDSLGHLLFNSIGLFFFGPWLERWWGGLRFLVFYLLCGCGGAALFTALALAGVVPSRLDTGLVGASAGIYGIFIGVAMIAPNLRVRLIIPPIEMSMRQLAIFLLVASVVLMTTGILGNQGGEAGHLGGAIVGFFLMRFPGLLQRLGGGPRPARPTANRAAGEPKLRPRSRFTADSDPEVDRILDKISREGFQSLTAAERDALQAAALRKPPEP